jgi:hypothetical protein
MIDPNRLPEVAGWIASKGGAFGFTQYVDEEIGHEGFLACASLLFPQFLIVRDCVLLPWQYNPATFEDWWTSLDGDRTRIEDVVNHVHLCDLFFFRPIDDEMSMEVARVLQASWHCAAKAQMPDRDVVVKLDTSDGAVLYVYTRRA